MQKSFVLFSLFTVKVLVWQEFKLILVLTVCSNKQKSGAKQPVHIIGYDGDCLNLRSFF